MKHFIHLLLLSLAALGAARVQAQTLQVEGGLARDLVVAPGDHLQEIIKLKNLGTTAVQVRVYQADYSYQLDQSRYDDPGTMPRSNAKWITCTPSLLSLAAGQGAEVLVQVAVPADASLAGSYWSMVMVEPQAPPVAAAQTEKGKVTVGIQTVFRYGIQIATTVGATGNADVRFAGKQVVAEAGQRRMEVDLANTGARALRPFVWAELHDADGALVKRVESTKARLYPGCTQRYSLDVTDVAPGHYAVLAVADNGDDNVFGARYELDLR